MAGEFHRRRSVWKALKRKAPFRLAYSFSLVMYVMYLYQCISVSVYQLRSDLGLEDVRVGIRVLYCRG